MFGTGTQNSTLAIMCGGYGRRLGTDKGLVEPLGDESLVVRSLRLLAEDFAEVLVVTRDGEQAELYKQHIAEHWQAPAGVVLRIVHDDERPFAAPSGAMNGLVSALFFARHAHIAVLPVDQLGIRKLHLRAMRKQMPDSLRPIAFHDGDGDALPFPSWWTKQHLQALRSFIDNGALSVRGALAETGARLLEPGDFHQELQINGNTQEDLVEYFGEPLEDTMRRRLHYLRFSMTEACNLSCTYCLPDGFPEWYRHKARLNGDDISTLLQGFRRLGFRKVRLTGGEPTVHPACLATVREARKYGFEDIAMTTNGLLIKDIDSWIDAGLTQINVSFDSLSPDSFEAVTGSRDAAKVRNIIEQAAARGLRTKVNTVLLRSKNGSKENIMELIDWALGLPISLRFIELMETKLNGDFSGSERVLGTEITPWLEERGLQPLDEGPGIRLGGPAVDWGKAEYPGQIGFINPMSCNFCNKCNRLRVTARGKLKMCLFGDHDQELDLSSPEAVALNVRGLIDRKPERHYLEEGRVGNVATFRTIGG